MESGKDCKALMLLVKGGGRGNEGSHILDKENINAIRHIWGKILEILPILSGEEDSLHSRTQSSDEFLLDASDGCHPSTKGDFTL